MRQVALQTARMVALGIRSTQMAQSVSRAVLPPVCVPSTAPTSLQHRCVHTSVRKFSSESDDDSPMLLDAILATEPHFLQWFVKVHVPALAAEEEPSLDTPEQVNALVSAAYEEWTRLDKPQIS